MLLTLTKNIKSRLVVKGYPQKKICSYYGSNNSDNCNCNSELHNYNNLTARGESFSFKNFGYSSQLKYCDKSPVLTKAHAAKFGSKS